MESLRITFVLQSMIRTGGTKVILSFARGLAGRGHQVRIVTSYKAKWFDLPESVQLLGPSNLGFAAAYLKQRFSGYSLQRDLKMHGTLAEAIPPSDISVATFSTTVYPIMWSVNAGVPFHHMQHFEVMFATSPAHRSFILSSYALELPRIANSSWLAARFKEFTGSEVPVLNPGIDHDVFYPRSGRSTDPHVFQILSLGKRGWKNVDTVIRSTQGLVKRYQDRLNIRLHLFGQFKPRGLPNYPFLTFHENVTDAELATLYSMADLYISQSMAESFPLAPLEAMACGCPVITTPTGTEDYVEAGGNALVVDYGDSRGLEEAVARVIEDKSLSERLGKKGQETAKRFTFTHQVPVYEQMLKTARDRFDADFAHKANLLKPQNLAI